MLNLRVNSYLVYHDPKVASSVVQFKHAISIQTLIGGFLDTEGLNTGDCLIDLLNIVSFETQ